MRVQSQGSSPKLGTVNHVLPAPLDNWVWVRWDDGTDTDEFIDDLTYLDGE